MQNINKILPQLAAYILIWFVIYMPQLEAVNDVFETLLKVGAVAMAFEIYDLKNKQ